MSNEDVVRALKDAMSPGDSNPRSAIWPIEFIDFVRSQSHSSGMEDKDVRRLEDRIEASNREAQLRLDAVLARMDGKFDGISQSIADIKTSQAETRDSMRTWGTWIIATVLAVGLSMAGLFVGIKQVWIGGVQVGQSVSAAASPVTKPAP